MTGAIKPGTSHPWNWRTDGLWLLALWGAALLFFWDVLLGGQTFYFRDTTGYYIPQATVTLRALSEGRIPHWEPTIGSGYPFQADPHSMVFYPLTLLMMLLPHPRGYCLFVAFHVPLGGTFLYLLLRRWGLAGMAAATGAAAFMFSGYLVSTTCLTTLLRGTIWAPLALLAYDGYVTHGSRRALLSTALVLAVQGSGTDPQYVLFTGMLLAANPWIRPPTAHRLSPASHALGLFQTALVAGLILAYQYLPLAQLITVSDRSLATHAGELGMFGVASGNLYNLLVSLPFPDPVSPYYMASFSGGLVPFYPDLYWGAPLLALALASLGWARAEIGPAASNNFRTSARVLMAVSVVSLLVSLEAPAPFFSLLTTLLPPLKLFRYPGKYLLLAGVTIPISVGLGVHGLRERNPHCEKLFGLGLLLPACAFGATCVALLANGQYFVDAFLSTAFALTGDRVVFLDVVRNGWLASLSLAMGISLGVGWLLVLARRGKMQRSLALTLVVSLSLLDLWWNTRQGCLTVPDAVETEARRMPQVLGASRIDRPPPRFISYEPGAPRFDAERTAAQYIILQKYLLTNLCGAQVGCDMILASMSVRLASYSERAILTASLGRQDRDRLAAALGCRFALRVEASENPPDIGKTLDRVGSVYVQELPNVSPRAFVARKARQLYPDENPVNRGALMQLQQEAPFEAAASTGAPEPLEPRAIGDCEIVNYRPERVEIRCELEGNGLLVLLDTYHPSWKATVDGVERPIVKVAGMFRGVRLETGPHRVIMTFQPTPFRIGLVISLITLAATLIGLALSGRAIVSATRS
ncbi:MAG: YfhO family protein [Candidatus Wallbacteria bacterium]|nr:YfhO family protein [Candidatus Wallbacteria bacterium]